jgi:hypothetical protein
VTRHKLAATVLATLALLALAAMSAEARKTKDMPNSGFCASGKHVGNVKNCKENGGKK